MCGSISMRHGGQQSQKCHSQASHTGVELYVELMRPRPHEFHQSR